MPHLTPDQAAKRRNKALDKKYPLIGELFHVTPDDEARRYQQIDEQLIVNHQKMDELHRQFYANAAENIALLIEHLGEDQVSSIVDAREQVAKTFPCLDSAAYVADFWWRQVVKYHQAL